MSISGINNELGIVKNNTRIVKKDTKKDMAESPKIKENKKDFSVKNTAKVTKTLTKQEVKSVIDKIKEEIEEDNSIDCMKGLSNIKEKIIDSLI